MCQHTPLCPDAQAVDREAAHVVQAHPEQGWSLLCNGIISFDDLGEICPDGHCNPAPVMPLPRRDLVLAAAA